MVLSTRVLSRDEVTLLSHEPLFESLTLSDLEDIAALLRRRRYRQGEVIYHQGDTGSDLFILLRGRVKMSIEVPAERRLTMGQIVDEGHAFGLHSLLDGGPRLTALLNVPCRVAKVLLRYAEREPNTNPRVEMSIVELAAMVGATRQSVSKVLTFFEHQRWAVVQRGSIEVTNEHGLNNFRLQNEF